MYDRDEVIRQCSIAVKNRAGGVSRALSAYLERSEGREEESLRGELVALSSGYERSAGDGSTYRERVDAARAALLAWDGPKQEEGHYELLDIRARAVIWRTIWGVSVDTDGKVSRVPSGFDELLSLGIRETGARGELAVLWALVEHQRRREAELSTRAGIELAKALDGVARELGQESARQLVERMPERLRAYVGAVWRSGL